MASYHLSVKTVSRAHGRSATAAAAYRSGCKMKDERTGQQHDYSRKRGVESRELVLPENAPAWAKDREKLWNAAEQAETRKNSTVAREFEIALPSELNSQERKALAHDFAKELVKTHQCAADVSIHQPNKEGDDRNHHAHILLTTRRLEPQGLTEKTRELDDKKLGSAFVQKWREKYAEMQNERLQEAGSKERVDHRSLEAQGINREPQRNIGAKAYSMERRTGEKSQTRATIEAEIANRLERAKSQGEAERQTNDSQIISLSTDLQAAIKERDSLKAPQKAPVSEAEQFKAEAAKRAATQQQAPQKAPVSEAEQFKAEAAKRAALKQTEPVSQAEINQAMQIMHSQLAETYKKNGQVYTPEIMQKMDEAGRKRLEAIPMTARNLIKSNEAQQLKQQAPVSEAEQFKAEAAKRAATQQQAPQKAPVSEAEQFKAEAAKRAATQQQAPQKAPVSEAEQFKAEAAKRQEQGFKTPQKGSQGQDMER